MNKHIAKLGDFTITVEEGWKFVDDEFKFHAWVGWKIENSKKIEILPMLPEVKKAINMFFTVYAKGQDSASFGGITLDEFLNGIFDAKDFTIASINHTSTKT